jgi:hypothetical protein
MLKTFKNKQQYKMLVFFKIFTFNVLHRILKRVYSQQNQVVVNKRALKLHLLIDSPTLLILSMKLNYVV